jgi:hypothetical protein
MKKLILTTCLTALSLAANAQYMNGNKLFSEMNSSSLSDKNFALGYILGVVDSYDEELFCIPRNANAGQLRDVVQQYLARNPKDRHLHGGALVAIALMDVYPCKKGGGV